jgi:hypothetical protein
MLMQFPVDMGKSTTLSTGQFGDNDSYQLPLELILQVIIFFWIFIFCL